jgi:hypothetical protein
MAAETTRLASLSVLGGSLHGRRLDIEEVVSEVLVGSDPDCHLVLDLPTISPIHAKLWTDLNGATVHDTHAPRGLYINLDRVQGQGHLGEGDVLWLGPPQEAGSVCVQCHFEPWVEVLPIAPDAGKGASASAAPIGAYEAVVLEEDALAPAARQAEPEPVVVAAPATAPASIGDAQDPFFVGAGEDSASAADAFFIEDAVGQRDEQERLPAEPAGGVPADEFFVADEIAPGSAGPADRGLSEALPPTAAPHPPAIDLPAREPPRKPQAAGAPAAAPERVAPAVPVPDRSPAPAPQPAAAPPGSTSRPATAKARPEAPAAAPRPVSPVRGATRPPVAARRAVPSGVRPAARRTAGRGSAPWLRPATLGLAGLALVAAAAFGAWQFLGGRVRLDQVAPARLRVGQKASLTGSGFASEAAGNTVLFGDKTAKVLQASSTRLEVEVPEVVAEAGSERRSSVVVQRGRRASRPVEVSVFQGPRLHGLSPEVALPGEEVLLAGAGWGVGATVRFGDLPAQVLDAQPTQIRAIVPAIPGGPGTPSPVVVTVGGVESNSAPFFVGHLPLVTALQPTTAAPGDEVLVSGRGFHRDPSANDVRVGGVAALVLSATDDELKVVVPRLGAGAPMRPLEVRFPGSAEVGQAQLQVPPPGETVDFRFVAEPFAAAPGRGHAVLTTDLGPAFVLAASGGRTAAQRALEAERRLNQSATVLRATRGLNLEARGLESSPVIGLAGRPDVLLEVTAEDAAAYNEDWTGLRGRGGPVTPARLALWWEALGRDLVLLSLRGEPPQFAAALAPEGRVLAQVYEAARRTGRFGVPESVAAEMRPALRDGLRLLALRVPSTVKAPALSAAVTAPASAGLNPPSTPTAPAADRLRLEGTWTGSETEEGQQRYLTVSFSHGGGTVAYEGGITFTVPIVAVEQPRRDQVQFSVPIRGGVRYYQGRWDGQAIHGSIARDTAGKNVVATFTLRPR